MQLQIFLLLSCLNMRNLQKCITWVQGQTVTLVLSVITEDCNILSWTKGRPSLTGRKEEKNAFWDIPAESNFFLFLGLLIHLVFVLGRWMCPCTCVEVRGRLAGIISLLPSGFWEWDSAQLQGHKLLSSLSHLDGLWLHFLSPDTECSTIHL